MAFTRTYLARKKSYLARKNFYLWDKIFYIWGRNHWFSGKKEERTQCLRALSSSQYKYTTFSREIQIALTFRNNRRNVKMQRFAADGGWQVLYYEGLVSAALLPCLSRYIRLPSFIVSVLVPTAGPLINARETLWIRKGRFYKLACDEFSAIVP